MNEGVKGGMNNCLVDDQEGGVVEGADGVCQA